VVTRLGVFEDGGYARLAPLTDLRPVFALWGGIAPAWQRLEALYGAPVVVARCRAPLAAWCAREMPGVRAGALGPNDRALLVNGALFASLELSAQIPLDGPDEIIVSDGRIAALRVSAATLAKLPDAPLPESMHGEPLPHVLSALPVRESAFSLAAHAWDYVAENESRLREDFEVFAKLIEARRIAKADEIGVDCFIGDGATLSSKASLDASEGPVLIGAGVTIEPFAFVKGPVFIGAGARVRAGCRVEGGSTVAPGCRIGGEVEASILYPFMNKQHDGFLGHSIVGSWTNLGAGFTTSDLKNNYGTVRSVVMGERIDSGLTKLGAVIGDHSKIGIGTLLSAGAVIGTAAQVAGVPGVVSGVIPSFAWWAGESRAVHDLDRALETARTVVARRGRTLERDEEALFRALFASTESAGERELWLAAARER